MEFRTATITSAGLKAWYHDLLYSQVEVTSEPFYKKNNFSDAPSQDDQFVLKASYLENQDRKCGEKTYKCIKRSSLQFANEEQLDFEF